MRRLLNVGRYPEYIRLAWWRWCVPMRVRGYGVDVAQTAGFLGMPIISMSPQSRIQIGERVSLCSSSLYTALGINHPVVLRTLQRGAVIEIGDDTGISGASICADTHVSIGKQCLIGANVTIADTDFHQIKPDNRRYSNQQEHVGSKPVRIGNNVFLGAGVIVLKGVTVGDNSVVGAGSVVVKDIPSNCIAAGNPARVIKALV